MKSEIINKVLDIDFSTFIRAFFHDEKANIYLRTIDDNKDRKEPSRNYEVELRYLERIIPTLQKANDNGHGVFFVVNGGGQHDDQVITSKSCTAQYMEIDEDKNGNTISFDEQLNIINSFPLRPSIVVRTRKSLHSYWLLRNGDIKKFRTIQKRLISYFHSDSSIQNESRVMRVPGFFHCKAEPIKVEVIHFEQELTYTQEELEAVLPDVISDNPQESKKTLIDKAQKITSHRVDTLVSLIGTFKAKGLTNEVIQKSIIDINQTMCEPPISQDRLLREVFPAIERFPSMEVSLTAYNPLIFKGLLVLKPNLRYKWNDRGNGNLFADVFKNKLRWNTTQEDWFFYNKKAWILDEGGMLASNHAKKLYDALLAYNAKCIEDDDTKTKYLKHISGLGERHERENMLKDSRDFYCINSNMLDADGYLLNCQNGTLNLKTMELTAHDPEQLLSKICNANYNPNIRSNLWEWFVGDIMFGEVEKIEYLQKLSGYMLLGKTSEEEMYIFHGRSTRNGKSTFIETLAYMLGNDSGYALKVDSKSFGFSRNASVNQARGDIARLKGARIAYTSEPDKQLTFDAGLLKQLTGGNLISARFNYGEVIQFEPTFKIIVDCNNLPAITDCTLFDSDRIRVIPFEKHIPENERDLTLKAKLKEPDNMSGILNWCLEGLAMYYKEGLKPPKSVIDATNDYRAESDRLGAFLSECLVESESNCSGKKVYQMYQKWCRDNHIELEQKGEFFADLRAKGIMANTATVNGVTMHNVVIGYDLSLS